MDSYQSHTLITGINTTEISVKLERLDNRINGEQRQIDRIREDTQTIR